VIAAIDKKIAARVGELTFFDVLDPCAIDADGHVVLGFACHGACMAANTLALVDYEGIFRHELILLVYCKATLPLILV